MPAKNKLKQDFIKTLTTNKATVDALAAATTTTALYTVTLQKQQWQPILSAIITEANKVTRLR